MHNMHRLICSVVIAACATAQQSRFAVADDRYPTAALAQYVYLCTKANGETQDVLNRCACSIDVIASLVPYDDYVTAETYQRMSQLVGDRGAPFRGTVGAKQFGSELQRAEIEAEVRCF